MKVQGCISWVQSTNSIHSNSYQLQSYEFNKKFCPQVPETNFQLLICYTTLLVNWKLERFQLIYNTLFTIYIERLIRLCRSADKLWWCCNICVSRFFIAVWICLRQLPHHWCRHECVWQRCTWETILRCRRACWPTTQLLLRHCVARPQRTG